MKLSDILQHRLEQAIAAHTFPGCIVGVVKSNGQTIIVPAGHFTYGANAQTIQQDTIFDVASITKSIPTACLALALIEQQKIGLDDKVISYIPELTNRYKNDMTVRHLLEYSVVFASEGSHFALSVHKDKSAEEILQAIFTAELAARPGTQFAYTNATSILLGLVIERISDQSLDDLASELFFRPLKMVNTTFHPKTLDTEAIVPTEIDDWRGRIIQGEVHDESAYALQPKVVGSAGLFSTAPDLLRFCQMLLQNGELEGKRYLSKKIIDQMTVSNYSAIGEHFGLGWSLNQPEWMGDLATSATFGKTGFTGCSVVCDRNKGVGLVILSNYIYPKRPAKRDAINKVRRDIADIVWQHSNGL